MRACNCPNYNAHIAFLIIVRTLEVMVLGKATLEVL